MAKDLIFLGILGAATILTVACFWLEYRLRQARRLQRLADAERREYRQRLAVLEGHLALEQEASAEAIPAGAAGAKQSVFPGALQQAGLRLRLQAGQQRAPGVVERYRLVTSMVRRGISAEDIGAVLQISGSETEQLLKLSQVARQAA